MKIRLRPSQSSRWLACPGSAAACAALPGESQSEAASKGTLAHAVLECSLRLDYRTPPTTLFYEPVSLEMRAGVQMALDHVYAWQQRNPLGWVWPEEELSAEPFFDFPLAGTPDVVMQIPDEIEIVDLKYGRVQVEADNNTQMRIYGVSAVCQRQMQWPKRFTFTIVQPRGNKFPIDSWQVNASDVQEWARDYVKPVIKLIKKEGINAPRYAGDWCKYCRAKINCQTYVDYVFQGFHENPSEHDR